MYNQPHFEGINIREEFFFEIFQNSPPVPLSTVA